MNRGLAKAFPEYVRKPDCGNVHAAKNIRISRSYVGEYMTSLEMQAPAVSALQNFLKKNA